MFTEEMKENLILGIEQIESNAFDSFARVEVLECIFKFLVDNNDTDTDFYEELTSVVLSVTTLRELENKFDNISYGLGYYKALCDLYDFHIVSEREKELDAIRIKYINENLELINRIRLSDNRSKPVTLKELQGYMPIGLNKKLQELNSLKLTRMRISYNLVDFDVELTRTCKRLLEKLKNSKVDNNE